MKLLIPYRFFYSLLIFFALCFTIKAQTSTYSVKGVVVDSISGKPIEYVAAILLKSNSGALTDEKGNFSLMNKASAPTKLRLSCMGYITKDIPITPRKTYNFMIKLKPEGIQIKEVYVRKKEKEKYSKKDNPAVALIKKVIANKNKNYIGNEDYYRMSSYERIFFALNDYHPDRGLLKSQKYLAKYADTSRLDGKKILPYTVREKYYDIYTRKNPRETKKILLGYNKQGIDQKMDNAGLETLTDETFKDINIRDNNITMFLLGFVGPLHENASVNFYRWYIRDTVKIDNEKYIQLGFLPFNTRDVGFSGDIFVKDDTTYAIKRIQMRVPRKANINFVKDMLIEEDFEQLPNGIWAPSHYATTVNFEYTKLGKLYVQKDVTFSNITTNMPNNIVFATPAPEVKVENYNKQTKQFWEENRPHKVARDLRLDSMMMEINRNHFLNLSLKAADFLQSGYLHENWDPAKNRLDIGTAQTFYSHNKVEGNRFRISVATTPNLNNHLYFFGYGAYGTKDETWKYKGEVTWAFNKREQHKDEFPRNNIVVSYKYDVNNLGQEFYQATQDNFLQSFKVSDVDNMTYEREFELSYNKEWYNGFSVLISGITNQKEAAGNLAFNYSDGNGNITRLNHLNTTVASVNLRYAYNEKFVQIKRFRQTVPTESTILTFDNSWGIKNVLGGDYSYHTMALGINKAKWIPPFGKLFFGLKGEKIWGTVPFPLLLTPNANNSYTLLRNSFNLVTPLEFLNDQQVTGSIDYYMGGWLLNRIPVIKLLKLREVFGIRGFLGSLKDKNNPDYNHNTLLFPDVSQNMGKTPYMEYNVGIENIFKLLRVDYVRRINYLDHPGIKKNGIRIGFKMDF
ncbi:MAG: DUF5686 family protein [Dysgonamonadaceae bacterium]